MRKGIRMLVCGLTVLAGGLAWKSDGQAVDSVNPPRPLLITVDDLPIAVGRLHPDAADREKITQGLLAALEKHHIHAIAVVTWSNLILDSDKKLLELWLAAGHELGNHSNHHLSYSQTDSAAYIA